MSIKLMTLVWDKLPVSGSELLAMLALADWAADDGGSLYPSMAAVAAKIRLSEKQARRITQGFVRDGFLQVVGNEHGGAPGTTKQFRLNVKKLASLPDLPAKHPAAYAGETPPASVTPPMDVTPPVDVRDPSHRCPETAPMGGSLTTIEPSIEPPRIQRACARQAQAPAFPRLDNPAIDVEVSEPQPAPSAVQPAKVGQSVKAAGIARPDDVPAQVWSDFLQIRKAKRSPLTATALAAISREASKAGLGLSDALEACCERGWTSFRAEWIAADGRGPTASPQRAQRYGTTARQELIAGAAAAIFEGATHV